MSGEEDQKQPTDSGKHGDNLTIDGYCNLLPDFLREGVRQKLVALGNRLEEAKANSRPLFVLFLRVKGCHLDYVSLLEVGSSGLSLSQTKMSPGGERFEISIAGTGEISCLPAELKNRRYRFTPGGRFLETDPVVHNFLPGREEFIVGVQRVFKQESGTLWSLVDGSQIETIAQQNQELGEHILPMKEMLAKAERNELELWNDYVIR